LLLCSNEQGHLLHARSTSFPRQRR
jgi:hypothetical protein